MLDKALLVIISMYAISIAFLTIEYTVVDVLDIEVTNYRGETLNGTLIETWMNMDTFNDQSTLIINGTFNENTTDYNRVETSVTAAAAVAWNLIILLTGTQIFALMYFFGVPSPLVAGMVILYMLLLARAIFGYINRVLAGTLSLLTGLISA